MISLHSNLHYHFCEMMYFSQTRFSVYFVSCTFTIHFVYRLFIFPMFNCLHHNLATIPLLIGLNLALLFLDCVTKSLPTTKFRLLFTK